MCVLRGHLPAAYRLRRSPAAGYCGIAAGHDPSGRVVSDLRMSRGTEISSCGLSRGRGSSAYVQHVVDDAGAGHGWISPGAELRVMRSHTRGFFPKPVAAKEPEITFLFWEIKIRS